MDGGRLPPRRAGVPMEEAGTIVHWSATSEARLLSGRRLATRCPGRLGTAVLSMLALFWGAGGTGALIAGALQGEPILILGGLPGIAGAAGVGAAVRSRLRSMGDFVVDADAGRLERRRGATVEGEWRLDEVRFERAGDPFQRGFAAQH